MQALLTFPEMTRSVLALEQLQFCEGGFETVCAKLIRLANEFCDLAFSEKDRKPFETARLFRHFLISGGFGVSTEPEWECFTLSGTLLNNAGSCLGLTTLHYALGEIVGLPIKTVLFEGHIVPVYMDGETPIYIETTRSSSVMYECSIRQLHGNPFKLLSSEEFLAVHLSNRASLVYARADLMDDAIFLIDSALNMYPDYTAGWINRAAMMKKLNNTYEMRRSLDMAKSLHPGFRYAKAIEQIENNITPIEKLA